MSKFIEIYDLDFCGNADKVFINVESISSIKKSQCFDNNYIITMNNDDVFEINKDSFDKMMKYINEN